MHVALFVLFFKPEVLEQIHNLKELWLDNNSIQRIPGVSSSPLTRITLTYDSILELNHMMLEEKPVTSLSWAKQHKSK